MNVEGELDPVWTRGSILPKPIVDILESKTKTWKKAGADSGVDAGASEDINPEIVENSDEDEDAEPDVNGDDIEWEDNVMNNDCNI